MELVTVVNRTSKPLKGTWDGRPYDIPPGESVHPLIIAQKMKFQNPQMGTANPQTGEQTYLIGIKEEGDPCDPIEQTTAIEQWDRSKLRGARPSEVVPGDNGIYSVRDVATTLPLDTKFVKP